MQAIYPKEDRSKKWNGKIYLSVRESLKKKNEGDGLTLT